MLKITNVAVPLQCNAEGMKNLIAARLGLPARDLVTYRVLKKSVDARDKGKLRYVMNFAVSVLKDESRLIESLCDPGVTRYEEMTAAFLLNARKRAFRPVVVGFGPAGMFAGLALAKAGLSPVILERGAQISERRAAVEKFWAGGVFTDLSSVQFGEGGAGTFSDGKLTTSISDARCALILRELVKHGAPEEILYEAKPHIGTDKLAGVVRGIRESIIKLGGEVRFKARFTGFERAGSGALSAVRYQTERGEERFETDTVLLAVGHSARDTVTSLYEAGVTMQQKDFSVGVRIEHLQQMINRSQYGERWRELPPADYKLAAHLKSGRSVYTFCMCPGGTVVNGCSEPGGIVTNGMSEYARSGENSNAALLVNVGGADFGSAHPLAGIAFQRRWERAAYAVSNSYRAPAQRVADFMAEVRTKSFGSVVPTYRPGVVPASLKACLPEFVTDSIREALPLLNNRLRGFSDGDAVMTGVETRSSSPVRMLRDEGFESGVPGLYPCGEGAGYAGGIMSAAGDGLRTAEKVIQRK